MIDPQYFPDPPEVETVIELELDDNYHVLSTRVSERKKHEHKQKEKIPSQGRVFKTHI